MILSRLKSTSLALRISLATAAILLFAGMFAGAAIFHTVQHSLHQDLESKINERLEWIEASIELEKGRLEFEPNQAHFESDVSWQVTFLDGQVLWSENWQEHAHKTTTKTRPITVGNAESPIALTQSIHRLEEIGKYGHPYQLNNPNEKIQLRVKVRAYNGYIGEELRRLSFALWTVGPLSIFGISAILAWFVRRQLRPLEEIASHASRIGPETLNSRIASGGNSIECVRLQHSLNMMISRLEEGLGRERLFASAAAHELRTPIAQLRTSIEVEMRKDRTLEEYKKALTQTLDDVIRMQNLVEQLLLLTKMQQSASELEPLSLSDLITQAQKAADVQATCGASIREFKIKGKPELVICGLRNVLQNAARYAPNKQPSIDACLKDGDIEVVVADNGPGISETNLERIFDPLLRLDNARSIGDSANGFGLGLTVSRAAIQACGGFLFCRARSDGNSGAEFVFRFKKA